jgi:hypothetical protein
MSNESPKEKAIKEIRTIEATKKNLMGVAGKLGIIVTTFGHPIIRQGSGLYNPSFLEDYYEDDSDNEYEITASGQQGPLMGSDKIQDMGDDFSTIEGYVFDGLSRAMHLEIKYFQTNQRIEVHYKGFLVYKELAGELQCYNPQKVWEDLIAKLYEQAKKAAKKRKIEENQELKRKIEKNKISYWRVLKERWGL